MVELGFYLGSDESAVAEAHRWWVIAAEAGHPNAMTLLAGRSRDLDQQEYWYRRAASRGYALGAWGLGRVLEAKGDVAGAELYYHQAINLGEWVAAVDLGELLDRQGRGPEAERLYLEASAHLPGAWYAMAKLLERQGRHFEAAQWRKINYPAVWRLLADRLDTEGDRGKARYWRDKAFQYEHPDQGLAGSIHLGVETVVVTAVVTAAVLPFLQSLAGKAAEDVHGLLRQMFRRGRKSRTQPRHEGDNQLLIIEDPGTDVDLYVWLNRSPEAMTALASLNLQHFSDTASGPGPPPLSGTHRSSVAAQATRVESARGTRPTAA
jgi:tetratricopeptide (TPR) repeat protein